MNVSTCAATAPPERRRHVALAGVPREVERAKRIGNGSRHRTIPPQRFCPQIASSNAVRIIGAGGDRVSAWSRPPVLRLAQTRAEFSGEKFDAGSGARAIRAADRAPDVRHFWAWLPKAELGAPAAVTEGFRCPDHGGSHSPRINAVPVSSMPYKRPGDSGDRLVRLFIAIATFVIILATFFYALTRVLSH